MTIFCVFPYKSIITRSPFCLQIFLSLRAQYACMSVISRNDKTGKYRQNNLITTMECRNYKIVPASSIKISYINTSKNSSRLPGCLAKRVSQTSVQSTILL